MHTHSGILILDVVVKVGYKSHGIKLRSVVEIPRSYRCIQRTGTRATAPSTSFIALTVLTYWRPRTHTRSPKRVMVGLDHFCANGGFSGIFPISGLVALHTCHA